MEIIHSIDDLGKYMMNTMKQYLNCLEQTSAQLSSKAPKISDNGEKEPKKHHKLFGKRGANVEE